MRFVIVNIMNSKELRNRVYNFSLQVIQFLDAIEIKRIYFSISDQLLRSSTSIGANLIEARAAHSRKDFIKFYEIALKSCNESKYWICIFRDGLKINNSQIKKNFTRSRRTFKNISFFDYNIEIK